MAEAMTAHWVERVKELEAIRRDHFDSKVVGLGLRVSRTGKKVWFVQYRVKGDPKRRRLTLDPYPQMSLADAREKAKEVLLAASRGSDPAGKKQELREAPTVQEFAEAYLVAFKMAGKKTAKETERTIKADILPAWGRRKVHDISRRDVNALMEVIGDRGALIQANRTLGLLRRMFNWAISKDIVEFNPCNQVKPFDAERQRDRVLNENEIRDVWAAFECEDELLCTFFKLRLLTAQRGGEIKSMRWADVDLERNWWTIPAAQTKNGTLHRVPLSPMVVELLLAIREYSGGSEWVFPSPRLKGMPIENTKKAADRIVKVSGVAHVPHDLRRTAATFMGEMRVDEFTIGQVLNHKRQTVTRIYNRHTYDDEKRAALEKWEARLRAILATPTNNQSAVDRN